MPEMSQPGTPDDPRSGAKRELMRMQRARALKRQSEEHKNAVLKLATTEIGKIVGQDAAEHDEPWDYVKDVVNHGCSSGIVSGLIYYTETCKFYADHKEEIWEQLAEDASNAGLGVLAYMSQFPWGADVADPDVFENNLAWYGYERAAYDLLMRHESEEEEE